jgi:hypothetical protein
VEVSPYPMYTLFSIDRCFLSIGSFDLAVYFRVYGQSTLHVLHSHVSKPEASGARSQRISPAEYTVSFKGSQL